MVETFTPAVCGSRSRRRVALATFAVAAVLAAALLGGALALAGEAVGARRVVLAVAALAFLAALREAGVARFRLPQARRQVPQRWRHELPLPLWSAGYGAGLGLGFLTFQPFATFWIACAAAVALARPLPAAICFSLFGAGRAATAALARGTDGSAAVERLLPRRPVIARANAVVLAACGVLLAVAPAAGAGVSSLGAGWDPAVSGGVMARAKGSPAEVLVSPRGDPAVSYPDALAPGLDGEYLAYADASGIRVVRWETDQQIAHLRGPYSKPALDWPRLAYVATGSKKKSLILSNLRNPAAPTKRVVAQLARANDLGRPSLRFGRLTFHVTGPKISIIRMMKLSVGRTNTFRRSRIALLTNPSLSKSRIVWVEQRGRRSSLMRKAFSRRKVTRLYSMKSGRAGLWTTALQGHTAYVARWSYRTRASAILRVTF